MATAKKGGGAASSSAAPTAPTGNKFEFWVPIAGKKPALPPPPPPAQPAPTAPTTSAGKSKSSGPTPHAFIKSAFKPTKTSPFGTNGAFGAGGSGHLAISKLLLVRATLELGYGPRNTWTAALVLDKSAGKELASHLLLRLQSILTCLDDTSNGAYSPRPFYDRIEPSEKVSISFALGSTFSYLAARMWLEAAGERLKLFLHAGIYTKAIATKSAAIHFASSSNQRPDFLVQSSSGEWSLFESKGGTSAKRWAQLLKGLRQLEGAPHVGWSSGPPAQPPQAVVCVHTDVDTSKPLAVTAIDPPPDDRPPGLGSEEPAPRAPDLVLVKGVPELMVFLQAIEQFHAMDADSVARHEDDDWTTVETRRFEGLSVSIPSKLLRSEPQLRATLACYLATQELVVERDFEKIPTFDSRDLKFIVEWVARHPNTSDDVKAAVVELGPRLAAVQDGFIRAFLGGDGILRDVAEQLGARALTKDLAEEVLRVSALERFQGRDLVVSTGGLRLEARTALQARRESD